MKKLMRAAIYCRVSGHNQEREQTIDTQIEVCRDYCERQGWTVPDGCIYLDQNVKSETPTGKRRECSRLLRDARAGKFDILVVYKIDRLSRYREVADPFWRQMRELSIATDSPIDRLGDMSTSEGKLIYTFKMMIAEGELDGIHQRTRDGRNTVAASRWQWTKATGATTAGTPSGSAAAVPSATR